jgi:anti-sigma factor RsiW
MARQSELEHEDIREGDLLAYLDGEAAPALGRHIVNCSVCRADLANLMTIDARFSAVLRRVDCPSTETLLAFSADLLVPQQTRPVIEHLASCAHCRAELALIAAPAALSLAERVLQSGARVLRAVLMPPPALTPALRGDALEQRRYAVAGYELVLAIVPPLAAGGSFSVEGQLNSDQLATRPGEVRLLLDETEVRVDTIDELGFFALDDLAPALYTVQLRIGDDVVQVDAISVGAVSR